MAERVGDRHLESPMKLTACSETADVLRGFEQQNSLATFRQVGRADKAVVTGANDDGIVVLQWTLFPKQLLSSIRQEPGTPYPGLPA